MTPIKNCRWCDTDKSASEFYPNKENIDGLTSYCKECIKQFSRHQKHPEIPPPVKAVRTIRKCSVCQVYQPITEFSPKKRKDANDGLSSRCKKCAKELRKIDYWKNPEKAREYVRNRPYDPIKAKISRRIRWLRVHQDKNFTRQEWRDLKRKYNYTCLCCGQKVPKIKLTHDHIVPVSLGGSNTIDNIQPLCVSCNSRKHLEIIDYRPISIGRL